jgi:hypothetical protein
MSTRRKSIASIQNGKAISYFSKNPLCFMQKVRKAMPSSLKYPLSELMHVDAFTVGEKEEVNKAEGKIQRRKMLW